MKVLAILFISVCTSTLLGAQEHPENQVRQNFSPGGKLYIRLSPGGYTIAGVASDAIVVTCNAAITRRLNEVRVSVNAVGSHADVSISNTPHDNFHATIEVPARSDMNVQLAAGEVVIDGVEGNKDVEAYAGRIEIKIPHPEEYGHREASVRAGSIEAPAFDVSKGGLFRSFEQNGRGKYRLRAHVTTGEIDLRGPR